MVKTKSIKMVRDLKFDVNKNEAYIVKKETAFPEFLISYTDNGFNLIKDNDVIEFYNIGITKYIK